jgi:hypothetical protein
MYSNSSVQKAIVTFVSGGQFTIYISTHSKSPLHSLPRPPSLVSVLPSKSHTYLPAVVSCTSHFFVCGRFVQCSSLFYASRCRFLPPPSSSSPCKMLSTRTTPSLRRHRLHPSSFMNHSIDPPSSAFVIRTCISTCLLTCS